MEGVDFLAFAIVDVILEENVFLRENLVILKVVHHLFGAMLVDLVELNAPGNAIPLEVKQGVIGLSLLPLACSQFEAVLDDL